MALRKALFYLCLSIFSLCLVAGFGAAGQWLLALAALAPASAMLLAQKPDRHWLSSVSLAAVVILSAAGLLLGGPSLLMVLGSTAALAAWDLLNFTHAISGSLPDHARQMESAHLKSLALALGSALMVITIGLTIRLHVPFIVIFPLALLALFCLDRVLRELKSN